MKQSHLYNGNSCTGKTEFLYTDTASSILGKPLRVIPMTSCPGNTAHITDTLWGEFTGYRGFPHKWPAWMRNPGVVFIVSLNTLWNKDKIRQDKLGYKSGMITANNISSQGYCPINLTQTAMKVGPKSVLSSRRWANVRPTYIAVWVTHK